MLSKCWVLICFISVNLQLRCSLKTCREQGNCFFSFQVSSSSWGPHKQLSVYFRHELEQILAWREVLSGREMNLLHVGSTSLCLGCISADWLPDWSCSFQSHNTAHLAPTIGQSNKEGPFLFPKDITTNSTRKAHDPMKSIYSYLR